MRLACAGRIFFAFIQAFFMNYGLLISTGPFLVFVSII